MIGGEHLVIEKSHAGIGNRTTGRTFLGEGPVFIKEPDLCIGGSIHLIVILILNAAVKEKRAHVLDRTVVLCLEELDVRDIGKVNHVDALVITSSGIEVVVPDNHASFITIREMDTCQGDNLLSLSRKGQIRILIFGHIDLGVAGVILLIKVVIMIGVPVLGVSVDPVILRDEVDITIVAGKPVLIGIIYGKSFMARRIERRDINGHL